MQLDLFDVLYENFRFTDPLKTITLFSGIGFQEMGMDLAEIPYEVIGTSEIDKFAILSYASIHTDYLKVRDTYEFPDKEIMVQYLQERNIGINLKTHKHTITNSTNIETVKDYYLACVLNNNLGDISKVQGNVIQQGIDLLTYSFPCTDLSKAGQQAGMGCGTRSGLVYEVLRILHELKEQNNLPKVLIMENVIDLIQVKFVDEWNKIALEIEQMGYTNFTQELNGKDYGIAQNRRRVFMVSVLGDCNYNFPQPIELEYRLKDYLEDNVDENYYLSDSELSFVGNKFIKVPEATIQGYALAKNGDGVYINRPHQKRGVVQDGMIQTIKTGANDIGVVVDEPQAVEQRVDEGLRYFKDNLMGTLRATDSGGDKRVVVGEPLCLNPKVNGKQPSLQDRIYDSNHISTAITTSFHPNYTDRSLRIRKLTPKETGRLMGMQDYQIDKQLQVTSRAQAYKQHGNGIIAQVIGFIIGMLWYENEKELKETMIKNSFTWLKEEECDIEQTSIQQ